MDLRVNKVPTGTYLTAPKLYNLGLLHLDPHLRRQQHLWTQEIANSCHSVGLPGTAWSPMYPLTNAQLDYGPGTPKDDCPCLRYIRPP